MNTERIESLVQQVQSLPDSSARDSALELVREVMELHAAGLERILEIVSDTETGGPIIDAIAADPLAGSMLLLHDLHPLDIETRVLRALSDPVFLARGARVELLNVSDGMVRVRINGATVTKSEVEAALYDAAPDATGIWVEGGAEERSSANGFVPLTQLLAG